MDWFSFAVGVVVGLIIAAIGVVAYVMWLAWATWQTS